MNTASDHTLLRRYFERQEEEAFTAFVSRHVDLVYSAAMRQVRSAPLAEEITQSVFGDLLQAGRELPSDTVYSAWLYRVTRCRAIDAIRAEARRRAREQTAAAIQSMNTEHSQWEAISPVIDEAMASLQDKDRMAVILRYFENKSLREVGEALGASEDAAQKRVQRAVGRLSSWIRRRGIQVGAGSLMTLLSTHAVQAAPVGMVVSIGSAATATAATALQIWTTQTTEAILMTTLKKTALVTLVTIGVGTGIYEAHQASRWKSKFHAQESSHTAAMKAVESDLDKTKQQLENSRKEIDRLKGDVQDIHRLRAEATRYRQTAENLQRQIQDRPATDAAATALLNRVAILRSQFDALPDAWIPEMELLTDSNWLQAARLNIDSEPSLRLAMSEIRSLGEWEVANAFSKALRAYSKDTGQDFPEHLSALTPYLETPLDEAIMERWRIAPAEEVGNVLMGGKSIITQTGPAVDDVFDKQIVVGPHGTGSTHFTQQADAKAIVELVTAYQASHPGIHPEDPSELMPYVTNETQRTALEKHIMRLTTPH